MRIIVISDTHGNYNALSSVFLRNSDADWFIHLGDGERELDRFIIEHPEYTEKVLHAAGNCDAGSLSPGYVELPLLNGHKLFATHGHIFGVKGGLGRLRMCAASRDCDIVLYGHTHVRFSTFEDGTYIMNPGSASCPHDGTKPSFGTIDVSDAGVLVNIADV
ncbi:MAG: YfcE family phosphodiesterase [Ruminococcus sp.]|nr:YfcE family phosphodiesterase [Ruminococcus sp.]